MVGFVPPIFIQILMILLRTLLILLFNVEMVWSFVEMTEEKNIIIIIFYLFKIAQKLKFINLNMAVQHKSEYVYPYKVKNIRINC